MNLQDLRPDQVARVYRGRADTCMCGCAGKYFTHPAHREYVGQHRGYAVDDAECDLAEVPCACSASCKPKGERVEFDGRLRPLLRRRLRLHHLRRLPRPRSITMSPRPKSRLEESTERYLRHNDAMSIKLAGRVSPAFDRVLNAEPLPLEDATERARKYWDAMEAKLSRRSSVPPRPR